MKSGIYMWICVPNGKRYIGSAVNLKQRKSVHLSDLRANEHHSPPFQSSFNKYGQEAFLFKVLIICSKEDLLIYEQAALDSLQPELNICLKAGSPLGIKHTLVAINNMKKAAARPETKAKKSTSIKLALSSPEVRERMSISSKITNSRPDLRLKSALRIVETMKRMSSDPCFLKRRGDAIKAGHARRRLVRGEQP